MIKQKVWADIRQCTSYVWCWTKLMPFRGYEAYYLISAVDYEADMGELEEWRAYAQCERLECSKAIEELSK